MPICQAIIYCYVLRVCSTLESNWAMALPTSSTALHYSMRGLPLSLDIEYAATN